MKWSYGVTTVPERRESLLPQTLSSLYNAGFDKPRLFVDGSQDTSLYSGYECTFRYPRVKQSANWLLGLIELYLRDPEADRYAIFEDDLLACRNLRQYLETSPYPNQGYCNLYTFPENQILCGEKKGWFASNQLGRGAVALVFNRLAVTIILSQPYLFWVPQQSRQWPRIDGVVLTAAKHGKWKEYCHNPSLVQHVGEVSALGNKQWPKAESFPGEDFDALSLL